MAGWATLWLGGIATLGVVLTLIARSLIPIPWLAGLLVGAASWRRWSPGVARA